MSNRVRAFGLLLACSTLSVAAPLHMRQTAFKAGESGRPAGWTVWSARPEIAPKTFVDDTHYRSQPGSLAISGNSNAAAYGGWEYLTGGITAGKRYRFVAYYRTAGVQTESSQIVARLDWRSEAGKTAGRPDYPYSITPEGEWTRLTLDAPAPDKAVAVKIELYLGNAPQATVWWDDISLEEIQPPGRRNVTIATVKFHPSDTPGVEGCGDDSDADLGWRRHAHQGPRDREPRVSRDLHLRRKLAGPRPERRDAGSGKEQRYGCRYFHRFEPPLR
jgi:hypothetical protein